MKFYASMADHVNNRSYLITHSARFENMALLLTEPDREEDVAAHPHVDLMFDPYMDVGARVTIHQMILMCSVGIGFKLVNLRDAIEILYVLDGYVEEMRRSVMSEPVQAYLEKLAPFRDRILGRVRYLIKTDPMIASLYEEKNPLAAFIGHITEVDKRVDAQRQNVSAHGMALNAVPLDQLLTGGATNYDY